MKLLGDDTNQSRAPPPTQLISAFVIVSLLPLCDYNYIPTILSFLKFKTTEPFSTREYF